MAKRVAKSKRAGQGKEQHRGGKKGMDSKGRGVAAGLTIPSLELIRTARLIRSHDKRLLGGRSEIKKPVGEKETGGGKVSFSDRESWESDGRLIGRCWALLPPPPSSTLYPRKKKKKSQDKKRVHPGWGVGVGGGGLPPREEGGDSVRVPIALRVGGGRRSADFVTGPKIGLKDRTTVWSGHTEGAGRTLAAGGGQWRRPLETRSKDGHRAPGPYQKRGGRSYADQPTPKMRPPVHQKTNQKPLQPPERNQENTSERRRSEFRNEDPSTRRGAFSVALGQVVAATHPPGKTNTPGSCTVTPLPEVANAGGGVARFGSVRGKGSPRILGCLEINKALRQHGHAKAPKKGMGNGQRGKNEGGKKYQTRSAGLTEKAGMVAACGGLGKATAGEVKVGKGDNGRRQTRSVRGGGRRQRWSYVRWVAHAAMM